MYRILDLFAGAGGLSLGFEMTKQFEVVAIVENNKNAAKTYIKNHPGLKNYDDILKVDFSQIIKEKGPIDVVIGGPPCQGFSNANRQRRQLINGSNELVKRYVKAIEKINPKAFVMENVKTIASSKHAFFVTHADEKYIKDVLKLKIHNKDVVLYDGSYVKQVNELCENHNIGDLLLLSEEELYLVLNIYNKKNKLKDYFSKTSNVKKVTTLVSHMSEKEGFPEWYNDITRNTKEILQSMIDNKGNIKSKLVEKIKVFWDIHRYYHGLYELQQKDAIYQTEILDRTIVVRMQTYIVIDFVRKAFKNLNYEINGKVLNAASFGVPQTRERFIMIGVKKECLKKEITLPEPLINDPKKYITVRDAIKDLAEYVPTTASMDETQKRIKKLKANTYYQKNIFSKGSMIFNHVCTETRDVAKKRFEMIEQGKNFHSLPKEFKSTYADPTRTQNTIYKRLSYDRPSDTVVNVRKSMWIHPVLNRAISAREAARLQSFPDDYVFYGTKDSVYQQIGNAVPPMLGRVVAERVLELIEE